MSHVESEFGEWSKAVEQQAARQPQRHDGDTAESPAVDNDGAKGRRFDSWVGHFIISKFPGACGGKGGFFSGTAERSSGGKTIRRGEFWRAISWRVTGFI